MPPSMSASAPSAIGPAAAICVAASAIRLIPAPAINTAPPNAISPCVPACSFGASCAAIAIMPTIAPAIRTIATCAPGPADASSLAAFTKIHTPAAAAANPTPNPSAFFAAADITLLPSLTGPDIPFVFLATLAAALPSFPNVPTMDPASLKIRPPMIRTGPAAAAIATHFTMVFCIAGSRLLNLSISPVKLSTNGFKTSLAIPPTLYLNTSNDELSFSRDPPIPDRSASAIFCELPVAASSELAYFCTWSGDALISAIHLAIWFFPKIAAAADICSWLFRLWKLSCNCFWTSTMLFMDPSELNISSPSFFIQTAPSLAGLASLASPVFNAVAPSAPLIPASPNTSVIAARSDIDHPTELQIGPAVAIASNKSVTVVLACACAVDRMSAAVVA